MNNSNKGKIIFVSMALVLLAITVIGLFSLATSPAQAASLTLAYVAGLSMILLPCTLPALLVIVPLSMGKGYQKGFLIALFFSIGMAITLTAYGVAMAALGKILYLDRATLLMWLVAGLAAYLFGLSELGLISYKGPSYSGSLPGFMAGSPTNYFKAFLMGILLGNAGIGCPNPAFYVLLTYIAGIGNLMTGGILGLIHGLGRATPLLAISILAIWGVNSMGWILNKKEALQQLVGWGLIGFAALITPKPIFGHAWWEESIFHKVWNRVVMIIGGEQIAESAYVEKQLGDMPVHDPLLLYGPWIFLALLIVIPILWGYAKNLQKKEVNRYVEKTA
ncbi:MAG TPA: cytochrome c biogenesis protein CcdA [Candidatus Limnocylindrales bacterium]|nr:cytochrome c biogenesis protein CcdA [Candidatus Limnocylindrales bacterium]